MEETRKPGIAKLAIEHDSTGFDCGHKALNTFIQLHALPGQRANISQTYVAAIDLRIIGYHTLVVGEVAYDAAPERLAKGLPHYPVPVLLLARQAVDRTCKGKGLGAALVLDAMRRALQVADVAGVRALLVHTKDGEAKSFYAHLGFEPFPGEPLTLCRLHKDIRAMFKLT